MQTELREPLSIARKFESKNSIEKEKRTMRTSNMIERMYILSAIAVFVFAGAATVANAASWDPTTTSSRDIDGDGTDESVYLWNNDDNGDGNLDNWTSDPSSENAYINQSGDNRAVIFDSSASTNLFRIGDGATGELEIRNDLNMEGSNVSRIGDAQGTGTVNHYSGHLSQSWNHIDVGDRGTGTYNMMGGLLEIGRGNLNIEGSDSIVNITGGELLIRNPPRANNGGGAFTGTLRVAGSAGGSGPSSIDFDRNDQGGRTWEQAGLLELAFDESGITPMEVSATDTGGATFESSAELDLSFLDGVTKPAQETTWTALIFGEDGITDNGLSLTGDTDDTKWSYSFVDTNSNGIEDELQVTYVPEPSSLVLLALGGLLLMKRRRS